MKWTLDGTLAECGGCGRSCERFCGAAAAVSRSGRDLNIYEAGSERPRQHRRFVPLPTLQLGRLFSFPARLRHLRKLVAQMKQEPQVKAPFPGQLVAAAGSGGVWRNFISTISPPSRRPSPSLRSHTPATSLLQKCSLAVCLCCRMGS